MIEFLKNLDYFCTPFELKIYGKSRLSSFLGFCFTFIICGIGIAVTITLGSELVNKKKPRVNVNDIYQPIASKYNISENLFQFAFTYQGEGDNYLKLLDKSLFNVEMRNFKRVLYVDAKTNEKISKITIDPIEFELCSNNLKYYTGLFNFHANKTGDNFDKILYNSKIQQSFCLKEKSLLIGGEFNSGFFSNILFQISKCINKTESEIKELESLGKSYIVCKSKQEQDSLIDGVDFQMIFTNSISNTNNYTHPFYSVIDNHFFKLDSNIFHHVDFYFKSQEISSDNGLVFEEKKFQKVMSKDYFREIISLKPINGIILNYYVNIGKTKVEIRRYYMKAQELGALVGGLIKIIMIFAQAISTFFNRYQFDLDLINHLFVVTDDFDNEIAYKGGFKKRKTSFNIQHYMELEKKLKESNMDLCQNKLDQNQTSQISKSPNHKQTNSIDISSFNGSERKNIKPSSFDEKINETPKEISYSIDSNNLPIPEDEKVNNFSKSKISVVRSPQKKEVFKEIENEKRTKLDNNVDEEVKVGKKSIEIHQINNAITKKKIEENEVKKENQIAVNPEGLIITYLDIILIYICFFKKKYMRLNKKLQYYKKNLDKKTDYSEVLSDILSFNEFKKMILDDNSSFAK